VIPLDRQIAGLAAAARAQFPEVPFLKSYTGAVVAQRGGNSFDFVPDDDTMPGMSGIPMKLPFPGLSFNLVPGSSARAVIRFAQGSPSTPEIHLWEAPGMQSWELDAAESVTVGCPQINLGSSIAIHPMILGDLYLLAESALFAGLASAIGAAAGSLTSAGAQGSWALAMPFVAAAATALDPVAGLFAAFEALAETFPSTIVKASG
jgi:hypothetical protein